MSFATDLTCIDVDVDVDVDVDDEIMATAQASFCLNTTIY